MVLDRLGVHRKPEVREAIEARGCESVLLPGYGPDFDPIELAFQQDRGVREGCGGEDEGGVGLSDRGCVGGGVVGGCGGLV